MTRSEKESWYRILPVRSTSILVISLPVMDVTYHPSPTSRMKISLFQVGCIYPSILCAGWLELFILVASTRSIWYLLLSGTCYSWPKRVWGFIWIQRWHNLHTWPNIQYSMDFVWAKHALRLYCCSNWHSLARYLITWRSRQRQGTVCRSSTSGTWQWYQ